MQSYPAKYFDKNGEFETTIRNDYKTLRMNLRGVEFLGESFTGLYTEEVDNPVLANFTFAQECLSDCKISYEMPIEIIAENNVIIGNLVVQIELGKPNEKGWSERDDVILVLSYDDKIFRSKVKSEWFENELLDIQNQLPINHKLKCCFGCIYSDYSVYGHGFFGDLMCYRNIKEDYKKVSDKKRFMEIMENFTEYVQETYLCEEFEVRKTGTGYRG
jgi:Family of unknown function (DUF6304)